MGKAFIQESTLSDIADSIRAKLGVQTTYLPSEMPDAIDSIQTGGGGQYDVLCFTAEQANSTVYLKCYNILDVNFQYSYDNSTWNNWTYTESGNFHQFSTITLSNIGDKVYLRGKNATLATNTSVASQFFMTGRIAASGELQSLLTYGGDSLIIPDYCFSGIFQSCTSLTTAPKLSAVIAGQYSYYCTFSGCTNLTTVPTFAVTKLGQYCCQLMFNGCNALTTFPSRLPATTLMAGCYYSMFQGCTSLTTTPELPATTLQPSCYNGMFQGCTSLTTAPELPATTLQSQCYQSMFNGCTSLTSAPELPAIALQTYCYYSMFNGCTSLTSAPELPATILQTYCYQLMFNGCTSLTTAPELPATTLVNNCYNSMFFGCSSLNYIKVGATSWNTSYASNWVTGVASTGVFIKPASTTITSGTSGIPNNWNSYDFDLFYDYTTHYTTITTTIPSASIYYTTDGTTPTTSSTQYSSSFSCPTGDYGKWITCLVVASGINFITQEKIENLFYIEANTSSTVQYNGHSNSIQYSTDGHTWTNYTNNSSISLGGSDRVYFKKYQNLGYIYYNGGSNYKFTFTGSVNVGGCLSFMSHGESINGVYDLQNYTQGGGRYMFYNCTQLVSAENLIINIQGVGTYYNESMFYGCTALTKPPKLPATTLAEYCYRSMFYGCTALTSAPELPATTLSGNCYANMFYGCSVLTAAPDLPAQTLASKCYDAMFYNCTLLNRVKVYATTWNTGNAASWLGGVSSTGDFYKPSNTTIPEGGSGIPSGWTVHNFNEI